MTAETEPQYQQETSTPGETGEQHAEVGRDRTAAAAEDLLVPLDADRDPILSVVVPTMNEEGGIEQCIDRIKAAVVDLGVPSEIVLSDSSTDRTPEIARRLGAIVYEPDRTGYGNAYRYAFDRCRGEVVAMGDGDTTYDFAELPKLFDHVAYGDADIAIGSRLNGEIKDGAMPPLHRYVGNPLLTRFLNAFYDAGVSDAHSGMRVMTRDAIERMELKTDGMEFASEMIMEAGAKGLTIAEEPITYHERTGEATLDSFRDGWRHVKFMLVNAPSYLFHVPAAALILLGVVSLAASVATAGSTVGPVYVGEYTAVAGSMGTIVGVQLAALAVFSVVAGNPIRRPSDRFSRWVLERFRLEHGATAGVCLAAAGGVLLVADLVTWVASGYTVVPALVPLMVAFTTVVVGAQVLFSSFCISLVGAERSHDRAGGDHR